MTKFQREQVAAAIQALRADDPRESYDFKRGVHTALKEVAWTMYRTNPKFDKDGFLKACGVY